MDTDKKFTSQRLDETGLYFYNARYYDAEIGRFISADSIIQNPANPQSLNRYTYVLNNPLKYTDPSGHFVDILFDIGSAAYDVYTIIKDPGDWENWAALGADAGCALVPFVAGGGVVVRGVTKADDVYDAYKSIDRGSDIAKMGIKGSDDVPSSLLKGPQDTFVYLGVKNDKAIYAGISKNLNARRLQHGTRFDWLDPITSNPLTRNQARAIEQALINRARNSLSITGFDVGTFTNIINSISPTRNKRFYQEAVDWGEAWLRKQGY